MPHCSGHFRAPAQMRSRCVGRGAARALPRETLAHHSANADDETEGLLNPHFSLPFEKVSRCPRLVLGSVTEGVNPFCRAPAPAGARRKESPRRRKAHMRASALRQPLRFLRLRLLFPKNLLLRKIFFGSPILWISSGASRRFLGKTEGLLCSHGAIGSLV